MSRLGASTVSRASSKWSRMESRRLSFEARRASCTLRCAEGLVRFDGTSLTVNEVSGTRFGVNLIPHTLTVTTWGSKQPGDGVKISKFDLFAALRGAADGVSVRDQRPRDIRRQDGVKPAPVPVSARGNHRGYAQRAHDRARRCRSRRTRATSSCRARYGDADAIDFMAKHGRGLICLTLTQARAHELRLEPWCAQQLRATARPSRYRSKRARASRTGISAHDRCPHHRHRHRSHQGAAEHRLAGPMYFRWWLAKAAS